MRDWTNLIILGFASAALLIAVKMIASDPIYHIRLEAILQFDVIDLVIAFMVGFVISKLS